MVSTIVMLSYLETSEKNIDVGDLLMFDSMGVFGSILEHYKIRQIKFDNTKFIIMKSSAIKVKLIIRLKLSMMIECYEFDKHLPTDPQTRTLDHAWLLLHLQ